MIENKHIPFHSLPAESKEFSPAKSAQTSSGHNFNPKSIAIQLWPLRDMVEKNLWQTLKNIHQIGFTGIETYSFDGSFFGISPLEFKTVCTNLNLRTFSTHAAITSQNAAAMAEKAALAGLHFILLPSMMARPQATVDDYRKFAAEMNTIGEICRQHKIRFGYHNHDFEFKSIDGVIPYDLLLQETDPGLVDFQMDVFWVVKAGFDPKHYFRKHPGRFASLHVKDLDKTGESCIVGNGTIHFQELFQQLEKAGTTLMVYEQEHFAEGTPLQCAKKSLGNLHLLLH